MTALIAPGDSCRAINKSNETITISWDNVDWHLPPGEEEIVSAEAVINFFGDPRSKHEMYSTKTSSGQVGWVPDRPSEVRRLRALWANHDGPEDIIVAPEVKILTLKGEEVTTVVDDPTGATVNPALITQSNERNLMAIIDHQQEQLQTLLRAAGLEGENIVSETDIPSDDSDDAQLAPTPAQAKPDHTDYDRM